MSMSVGRETVEGLTCVHVCWQGDGGGVDPCPCLLAGRRWRGSPVFVSVGREMVEGLIRVHVCWQGDGGGVELSLCLLAGRWWRG